MAWIPAKHIADTKPLKIYFRGALPNSNRQQRDLRNEVFAGCFGLDSALQLFRYRFWLLAIGTYSPDLNDFAVRWIHSCGSRSTVAAEAILHPVRESTNHWHNLRIHLPGICGTRFPAADFDRKRHNQGALAKQSRRHLLALGAYQFSRIQSSLLAGKSDLCV